MNVRIRFPCFVTLACCCAAALPLGADQASEEPYRLTVDVPQVVLNVTVRAKDGGFHTGLEAAAFRVYDRNRLQELTAFSKEERPATVGLVIDNSGSMTPQRLEVLRAASTFVEFSHPEDEFFVVHFNEHVRLGLEGAPFSSERGAVRKALSQLRPDGQTALYDAVSLALDHAVDGRWEKRALLVISDGGDNASQASFDEVLAKARRLGASIYTIGIYDPADPDRSPRVLRRLAAAGGGTAFFPHARADLAAICGQIATEIRRQYTLAFTPEQMGFEGRFRKIRVEARDEQGRKLEARTREGYYEPAKE
jgi:Ca-activated chloride channel homolog